MSRIPIRLRVTLAFALASAVVLAALGYFVYARYDSELSEQIDQSLRSHGDDIASLVAGGDLARNAKLLGREESFAQVLTRDGGIYATTPQLGSAPQLTSGEAAQAAQASFIVTRPHVRSISGEARLLARPARGPRGETFVVVTAASLDDRNESLANLRTILLIGIPVALLLASLAGYAVSGRALQPVEAMRRRAAAISAAEPEQRLPLPEADDEIRRLGETLNQMLGRLEAAIERERAFVDDASHELRTPLAMHKTELELALRYAKTPEEMRAAIASAIVEVDRLIQLAEDLLVLARSEEGKLALDLRRVGVGDLLGDVRERFSARMSEAGRSLVIAARERSDRRGRSAAARAGAHQPGGERDRARRRGDHGTRERGGRAAGDPRRGSRPGVRPGFHRAGLRALQPGGRLPRLRRHGSRPRDRRGDRPRAPGQRPRRQPRGAGADVWIVVPARPA